MVASLKSALSSRSGVSDAVEGHEIEIFEGDTSIFTRADESAPLNNSFSRLTTNQAITLSGALAGFLAGVAVCPLDVVKTRLQASGVSAITRSQTTEYGRFFGLLKNILKTEGIKGLYRGIVPITVGYLPTWTIYFNVYERTKRFYPQFLKKHFNIEAYSTSHFLSAISAGMVSSFLVNPIWVVKTRLMIQTGNGRTIYDKPTQVPATGSNSGPRLTYYTGTLDAFRKMYKEEGIRVFYSGLVPSMFGLLHVGIHFPVYEKLKQLLLSDSSGTVPENSKYYLWRLIIASSMSKMVASTITYPHEILRTRLQVQASKKKKLKASEKDGSKLLHFMSTIYKKEGLKGFYSGYYINLIRTVPASAVTLVSFEYFKSYFLKRAHACT